METGRSTCGVQSCSVPGFQKILPPVADQPATLVCILVRAAASGGNVRRSPTCTVEGLADNENVGGFFGGSFTVKLAVQVASPTLLHFWDPKLEPRPCITASATPIGIDAGRVFVLYP